VTPVPLIVTCEHASGRLPKRLAHAFTAHSAAVASHEGVDFGASLLARDFAAATGAPLFMGRVSRMVVDLNRSLGHPDLFSAAMLKMPPPVRQAAIDAYYTPHREAITAHVLAHAREANPLVHIGVHSFTPVWHGERRRVDIGLLFDTTRLEEAAFCRAWQQALRARCPTWRVRRNNPYSGAADGLTTALRRQTSPRAYYGIEIEMNQAMVALPAAEFARCRSHIVAAFLSAWGADKAS
jgi:predicted N-formylglutamate amidohydrolase